MPNAREVYQSVKMLSEGNLNSTRASYNAERKENCMCMVNGVLCPRCLHAAGPAVSSTRGSGTGAWPHSPEGLLATTMGMERPAAMPWNLLRATARQAPGGGLPPPACPCKITAGTVILLLNWEFPALGTVPQGCPQGMRPTCPMKRGSIPTPRFPNFPSSGTS